MHYQRQHIVTIRTNRKRRRNLIHHKTEGSIPCRWYPRPLALASKSRKIYIANLQWLCCYRFSPQKAMLKVIENEIKWEWQWLKTTLFRSVYNTYAFYVKIKLGEILITDQEENLTQSTKFETKF